MKSFLQNLFFLGFLMLVACREKKEEVIEIQPAVDKETVAAALTAFERNWRFEELSIENAAGRTTVNLAQHNSMISSATRTNVMPNVGFRFYPDKIDEILSGSILGNIPYGPKDWFSETGMGLTRDGSWAWDEKRNAFSIVPTGSMASIVSEMTGTDWAPEVGYIDNKMLPQFKSTEEAKAAGVPERVRILFDYEDPKGGKSIYAITLRGAWITEKITGTSREQFYKVVY